MTIQILAARFEVEAFTEIGQRREVHRRRGYGADFRDLKEGDLVVHVDHGIARYDGLTRLNVRGFAADFILLPFAGKYKLYLPLGAAYWPEDTYYKRWHPYVWAGTMDCTTIR